MKNLLALILLVLTVEHTPWRLLALLGETAVMQPGLTRVVKGSDRYWDARALEVRLTGLGWHVVYAPHLHSGMQEVYGVTDIRDRTIHIDSDLEWDARYMILAHEGGHALMTAYEWSDDSAAEAFAEAVATLVAHNGLREHARYLTNHRLALLMTVLTKSSRVYRAAAMLQE